MSRTITFAPALRGIVRVGLVDARGTRGAAASAGLDAELDRSVAALRAQFGGRSAGEIPHLQPARELYRAVGLDPTRKRPSPEALLRRILRGDPFPRVLPAVDLGNLWAVLHGLPVGLYDVAKIEGEVTLRLGIAGESYEGIRKDVVHLEGRLALADARGPFGNPSADSLRTAVDESSRDLLYVLFAPASYPAPDIERWLSWLDERVRTYLAATATAVANPIPAK